MNLFKKRQLSRLQRREHVVAPTITPYLHSCRELVEQELVKSASGYNRLTMAMVSKEVARYIFEGTLPTTFN